jgi:RNA polymerase sigma-70 factor (family 1)
MLKPLHKDKINEPLLIKQLKAGSQQAFEEIYRLYAGRLYAYCRQFTKSNLYTDEIVEDAFIWLWNNRQRIRQEDTVNALLFVSTKHYILNALRKTVNSVSYEDYMLYKNIFETNKVDQRLEYEEFLVEVKREISNLPPTQRAVVELSRFEQLSIDEIANKLGLKKQTVKNNLSMAMKTLRDAFEMKNTLIFIMFFVNLL